MRLIDADELRGILDHAVFHEYSNEYYGTMEAVDTVPGYELPPEQTTQSDDRWYRGYAEGWNACLRVIKAWPAGKKEAGE